MKSPNQTSHSYFHLLNGERLKAKKKNKKTFPLRSGTRGRCPLSSLLFNVLLEI